MDKTQFRTLMLQGKQVWVNSPTDDEEFYLYPDGSKIREFGYIWSACNEHADSVWIGNTFGNKEPYQTYIHASRVHVHMDGYTLPLTDIFKFIDKLGGFDAG